MSSQEEKLRTILTNLDTPEKIAAASEALYKRLRWADVRDLADIAKVDVFKTKRKK